MFIWDFSGGRGEEKRKILCYRVKRGSQINIKKRVKVNKKKRKGRGGLRKEETDSIVERERRATGSWILKHDKKKRGARV